MLITPATSESDGSRDIFYLSDLLPKDKPWDEHRANSDRVKHLYQDAGKVKYFERIDKCSRTLEFGRYTNSDDLIVFKLKSAFFCRVRLCPTCQWRRSLMWRARFFQAIPKIITDYPTAKFIFLTLTVRNCNLSELNSTIKHMNKSWQRLTQRTQWPALGFVRSMEVTRVWDCYSKGKYLGRHGNTWIIKWEKENKLILEKQPTDDCHPHFHCILMVQASYFSGQSYLSQTKWVELWKSCLQVDYTPIVDVRKIKSSEKTDSSSVDIGYDLTKAILETLKYGVKEADLIFDADWLVELTKQLHRTKAVSLGGVFKNYLSDDEPEDLIHTDLDEVIVSEPDLELFFGWREMVKRYAKK